VVRTLAPRRRAAAALITLAAASAGLALSAGAAAAAPTGTGTTTTTTTPAGATGTTSTTTTTAPVGASGQSAATVIATTRADVVTEAAVETRTVLTAHVGATAVSATVTTALGTRGGDVLEQHAGAHPSLLELRWMGTAGYLRADATTLQQLFGFTAAAATSEGGRWIVLPGAGRVLATDPGLNVKSFESTVSKVLASIDASASLTPLRRLHGESVLGVVGTATSKGVTSNITVYVSSGTDPLPVELIDRNTGLGVEVENFTWGVQPRLTRPAGAVPLQRGWLSKKTSGATGASGASGLG